MLKLLHLVLLRLLLLQCLMVLQRLLPECPLLLQLLVGSVTAASWVASLAASSQTLAERSTKPSASHLQTFYLLQLLLLLLLLLQ